MDNKILLYGFLLRILLVFIGEVNDYYTSSRGGNGGYSDIDYSVFTEGAKYVLQGQSPFMRHTYRYSPLMAYVMIPNLFFFPFGKIVFAISDILVALFSQKILLKTTQMSIESINNFNKIWVFNPLVINVATRGSADTLVALMVLITLYLLLIGKFKSAGFWFGLVVHFKIYPIIYALPMYFFIDHGKKKFFTQNRILFTVISASTFLSLLAIFYYLYGFQFLWEGYLYHLVRKDNRHNYSVYFYYIYLYFSDVTKIQSILAFLPQITLLVLTGLKFYKDLPFCIFLQTYFFVMLNKVCTAQYFIWYMAFYPLILQSSEISKSSFKKYFFIVLNLIWLIVILTWARLANLLEGQGINVFYEIFGINLIFFVVNAIIAAFIIKNQKIKVFQQKIKKN